MRKITFLSVFLLMTCLLSAQVVSDLFELQTAQNRKHNQVAPGHESFSIKKERLSSLHRLSPAGFELSIPSLRKAMKLTLKKVNITANDFSVIEELPGGSRRTITNYKDGVFYQGTIDGEEKSFATLSLFGDQVVAVIADQQGNQVLSPLQNEVGRATDEYVLYKETDLTIKNPFKCYTEEIEANAVTTRPSGNTPVIQDNFVGAPIDIYFECDYHLYQQQGSNTTNVINYVLAFFNSVQNIFANESVKVQISQIKVWTTPDPYVGYTATNTLLPAFRAAMETENYKGDFAHFLSTRFNGGGIAYLSNNPCLISKGYKSAVSMIFNTYADFPTSPYSWTVGVVAHELGHNFGSPHTQWCGWTGGALDNCYPTEPVTEGGTACALGPQPVNGGTIMSYCHTKATGINFNNGFGEQPGNRIRSIINNAACFATCTMTISVAIQDASCGQNSGAATITAENTTGALSYLWSNGQTGATLVNAAPGIYHVIVTDAAGCQVVEDIRIGNSGTSVNFILTPENTAGFCTGGSITLTASENPAYTYQWSLNGAPISGATEYNYTATTAGNYSVTVTSGSCSSTKSVLLSQVAPPPTPTITANGPLSFCNGDDVLLSTALGGGYTYQWYNGATLLNDATNSNYTATISGNYSVKVSAGNDCVITSPVTTVTVHAKPLATIIAGGSTTFCSGNSLLLTATNGSGYAFQWFNGGSPITTATGQTLSVTNSGNYTVRTTLGPCTSTSTATTITVLQTPTVVLSPATSTIQKFETVTLNGNGASTYNWSAHPSFVNSTSSSGTYRPLSNRTYTIEGSAANGCKSTASANVIVNGCGLVTEISAVAYSPSRIAITWKNPLGSTSDTLQYRKAGTTTWAKIFIDNIMPEQINTYEITGLEPGTTYEYNIISLCNTTAVFVPSAIHTIATPGLTGNLFIRLFPNPVVNTARLEVISSVNFTFQASLYDNTGKRIAIISQQQTLAPGQVIETVDVKGLANGIYYIGIDINGERHHVKLMVVH